jgi:hypothetical protein
MGSLVVRILGAVGAAALSVAMLGSGVASADALTGKNYSDAAEWISGRNGTPVIATVNGSQLEMDDCIITSWHTSIFLDSRGKNGRKNEYLLHLNCNNYLASPGHPGNSSMSPAGIAAQEDQQAAARINKNPEWCEKSDKNAQSCERICNRTGLCEI